MGFRVQTEFQLPGIRGNGDSCHGRVQGTLQMVTGASEALSEKNWCLGLRFVKVLKLTCQDNYSNPEFSSLALRGVVEDENRYPFF